MAQEAGSITTPKIVSINLGFNITRIIERGEEYVAKKTTQRMYFINGNNNINKDIAILLCSYTHNDYSELGGYIIRISLPMLYTFFVLCATCTWLVHIYQTDAVTSQTGRWYCWDPNSTRNLLCTTLIVFWRSFWAENNNLGICPQAPCLHPLKLLHPSLIATWRGPYLGRLLSIIPSSHPIGSRSSTSQGIGMNL